MLASAAFSRKYDRNGILISKKKSSRGSGPTDAYAPKKGKAAVDWRYATVVTPHDPSQ